MDKLKVLTTLACIPMLWLTGKSPADEPAAVSIERMTYDSDAVLVGRVVQQVPIKGGFVFVDTDKKRKSLDLLLTTFAVTAALKGVPIDSVTVCSIVSPQKFADIETEASYILFLQKTGRYYQRTYGSLSQIETRGGRVAMNYLSLPEEMDQATIEERVKQASSHRTHRFRSRPFNPYGGDPYRAIKNGCSK